MTQVQTGIPLWWKEAIAIEYLNCRHLPGEGALAKIDFSLIREEDLNHALLTHRVVIHGSLVHNISMNTWRRKLMKSLFSGVPVPVTTVEVNAIPEGPVGTYHFPFLTNPVHVYDPKLDCSTHFQVLDNGELWQWHFSDISEDKATNRSLWKSSEIDLSPLNEVPGKYQLLHTKLLPDLPELSDGQVNEIQEFYDWVESIRAPIRQRLWEMHEEKKLQFSGSGTAMPFAPPELSQFEEFKIAENHLLTRFHAEPLLYRAMLRHSRRASELATLNDFNLEDVYEERIQAVVNAAACLEAVVNSVGAELSSEWESYEKLELASKWKLCLLMAHSSEVFDSGREPYQTVDKIVVLRNQWLHYKKPWKRVTVQQHSSKSWLEIHMDEDFNEKLRSQVKSAVLKLHEATGLRLPRWVNSAPGWEL